MEAIESTLFRGYYHTKYIEYMYISRGWYGISNLNCVDVDSYAEPLSTSTRQIFQIDAILSLAENLANVTNLYEKQTLSFQ